MAAAEDREDELATLCWPPARATGGSMSRTSTRLRHRAFTIGLPRCRGSYALIRKSCWSVPATPLVKPQFSKADIVCVPSRSPIATELGYELGFSLLNHKLRYRNPNSIGIANVMTRVSLASEMTARSRTGSRLALLYLASTLDGCSATGAPSFDLF